jgi:hypothetical protein
MGIRTLQQVEQSLVPEPVYPGCKLRKGQAVMFTNDYGVTFGPHRIIGFCDGTGLLYRYGKHVYLSFDSYWCPVAESSLRDPTPCELNGHDWEASGCYSGGCVEYRCNACGATEDRDRS